MNHLAPSPQTPLPKDFVDNVKTSLCSALRNLRKMQSALPSPPLPFLKIGPGGLSSDEFVGELRAGLESTASITNSKLQTNKQSTNINSTTRKHRDPNSNRNHRNLQPSITYYQSPPQDTCRHHKETQP